VVWCNRYGQRRERLPGAPDCEIDSTADCAAHNCGKAPS
jgi:2-haloacid dehalogenase